MAKAARCRRWATPEENNHFYVLKDGSASAMGYFNEQKRAISRWTRRTRLASSQGTQSKPLHPRHPKPGRQPRDGGGGTANALGLGRRPGQHKRYDQIILARPIVALSNKDLGFLPGDAEEKINPYMQPLFDNLKFIQGNSTQ